MNEETHSKGERTRETVLQAAYELFLEKGYAATSVREIAERAGLALGGIYNHFANKDAIFSNLIIDRHPFHQVLPLLQATPGETVEKDAGSSPLQEQYVKKILPGIASQVPSVPSALLNLGLRSSIGFNGTGSLEATARLGAIMAVVDRGADSPDKSWLNVQRRNARWHGLDVRMLDELYTIAAENGW